MKKRDFERIVAARMKTDAMKLTLALELISLTERAMAIGVTLDELMEVGVEFNGGEAAL